MSAWTQEEHAAKTALVRKWSKAVDAGDSPQLAQAAAAFAEAGFVRNQHVGSDPKTMTPQTTLEWYAGQLMDMHATGALFAVNSWINCTDKFAPEKAGGRA